MLEVQHHNWDTVDYHGHRCVVECEWDTDCPDQNTQEHWLMIRPYDDTHGVYVVTETQLIQENTFKAA